LDLNHPFVYKHSGASEWFIGGEDLPCPRASARLLLLVMEILNTLIHKADEWLLLHQLAPRVIPHRASIYANDLMLFIRPQPQDLLLLEAIFEMFQGASGLRHNLAKCQMAHIRCEEDDIQLVSSIF
jgi:hypothetical protein